MPWERAEAPHWEHAQGTERPLCGPGFIWFGGIALPLLLNLYGIMCIMAGEAVLLGPSGNIVLRDINATFCGIGLMALGGVLHCQCFWDGIYGSTKACARRKLMCLMLLGVCAYAICLRMLHLI